MKYTPKGIAEMMSVYAELNHRYYHLQDPHTFLSLASQQMIANEFKKTLKKAKRKIPLELQKCLRFHDSDLDFKGLEQTLLYYIAHIVEPPSKPWI